MTNPIEGAGYSDNTPCSFSSIKPGEIKKVGPTTLSRIKNYALSLDIPEDEIIALLSKRYEQGATVKTLAEEVGIVVHSLRSLFKHCGIPIRSSSETTRQRNMKRWQDSEYRDSMTEAMRSRWQDPDFRIRTTSAIKVNWEDPDFREAQLGSIMERLPSTLLSPESKAKAVNAVRRNWQNQEYRGRMSDYASQNLRSLWSDPDYRQRQAELSGRRMTQQRKDPLFLKKMIEASSRKLTQLWQSPDFREKVIEAVRQARTNPENEGKYFLPTVAGVRGDVGFCQSTWEANLGRIMRLSGREVIRREPFRLSVPSEYQFSLGLQPATDFHLDYLTIDPRGNFVGYEIMAHPLEGAEGWLKAELFTQQHPEVRLVLVTETFYRRLRSHFKDRIVRHPDFIGWEDSKDNLRLNHDKWSARNNYS